ncbi:MAG: hypothetical protein ACM3VT_12980 [Solirubrobacterales bacterium]
MKCVRLFVQLCPVVLAVCCGCNTNSPSQCGEGLGGNSKPRQFLDGQRMAQQYREGVVKDYEMVWQLYDLKSDERTPFMDGFVDEFTRAGASSMGIACRVRMDEAVSGDQFRLGVDWGTKHAAKAATHEQIEESIRNSISLSPGASLGWKAGYIRGFAAQNLADLAARDVVTEARRKQLQTEAAAAYHALRAAVGS